MCFEYKLKIPSFIKNIIYQHCRGVYKNGSHGKQGRAGGAGETSWGYNDSSANTGAKRGHKSHRKPIFDTYYTDSSQLVINP